MPDDGQVEPIESGPLSNREIKELHAFLLAEDGLENPMDFFTFDGFICAVLSGPSAIAMAAVGLGPGARRAASGVSEREAGEAHCKPADRERLSRLGEGRCVPSASPRLLRAIPLRPVCSPLRPLDALGFRRQRPACRSGGRNASSLSFSPALWICRARADAGGGSVEPFQITKGPAIKPGPLRFPCRAQQYDTGATSSLAAAPAVHAAMETATGVLPACSGFRFV